MGACLLALIAPQTVYGLASTQLLSIPLPFIFIVLALRQAIAYANEFGRVLSSLLELRSELDITSTNALAI